MVPKNGHFESGSTLFKEGVCYRHHAGHLLVEGGLLHLEQPGVSSNARLCAEFHLEANIENQLRKSKRKFNYENQNENLTLKISMESKI